MAFDITLPDVAAFLAISAFSLLMLSELLSARYGRVYLPMDPKKLKLASYTFAAAFFVVVVVRIALSNV